MSNRLLMLIVFFCGMTTLGVELAASRLLAPFFGSSLLIWANLIGVILVYLSIGYYLGGRWADRDPRPVTLCLIVAVAGFAVGILPFLAAPVLLLAIPALAQFNAELGLLSFAGVVLLFAVPVTLLGCVTPFALRLAARDINTVGATGGNLYAISTIGSILGVYLTVFWMIPTLGTRASFIVFSVILLTLAVLSLWQSVSHKAALSVAGLLLLVIALTALDRGGLIKAVPNVVYETESQYNFIQVIEDNGSLLLTVNEGQAYQSVYHPNTVLLGGYWDLFLISPFVNTSEPPHSLLVIGLAAGTVTHQFAQVFSNIKMDGVEIDPVILDVGRKFFSMDEPNLNTIVDDGRAYLRRTDDQYDLIVVDAYRQPYIPFHLATVEYYQELAQHLTPRGVIAINAARTPTDDRLVSALASTLRQVFPTVFLMDYPNDTNTIILASPKVVSLDSYRSHLAALNAPLLRYVAASELSDLRVAQADGPVFTDDRSNVENLIHSIIFDATVGAAQ